MFDAENGQEPPFKRRIWKVPIDDFLSRKM
jgi:hypothetical protein